MDSNVAKSTLLPIAVLLLGQGISQSVSAHGLIEEPASRNWLCGAITKPDQVLNGSAELPFCGEAFADDPNAGYQFMSVLTHDRGRASVRPLPDNVCGFNSETFNYGPTPWDAAIDWPATPFSAGRQEFMWNIEWGPHFDDTEEFRYWITKPDFQYDPGRALTWDDFESTEFCALEYNDATPDANPDVISLKGEAQFRTFCNVPQRQGRHVIYGEWGRNEFTLERFHSCMDVQFAGGGTVPAITDPVVEVESIFTTSPQFSTVLGTTSVTLNASASTGDNLSYIWSVDAPDNSLYQLSSANQATTTLSMSNPSAVQSVTISLMVSNSDGSSSSSMEFTHRPAQPTNLLSDLGPLTNKPRELKAGDAVSVRTVNSEGRDTYYPSEPLVLNSETASAGYWPYALALAVNSTSNAGIRIGVLSDGTNVNPSFDATSNRFYTTANTNIVSAFLMVDEFVEEVVIPVVPQEPIVPEMPEPEVTPPTGSQDESCTIYVRDGANPWWVGFDLSTDASTVSLDFSGTGVDLTNNITIDSGVFSTSVNGQVITLVKPDWVSSTVGGYFGFSASNNSALATLSAPTCTM